MQPLMAWRVQTELLLGRVGLLQQFSVPLAKAFFEVFLDDEYLTGRRFQRA